MKIISGAIKPIVALYLIPLKIPSLFNLALNKVLKHEFWQFYYGKFLQNYPHITRSCDRLQNDYPLIFDVGGGTGTTAELYNKHKPNATIHVFEPIEKNHKIITNLFRNEDKVIVHKVAAGDKDMTTSINIAARITSSSILELNSTEFIKGSHLAESLNKNSTQEIEIRRLESYMREVDSIDILKLDVQGYEINALIGCGEQLKKVQQIVVEVSNHGGYVGAAKYYQVDEFLREKDFVLAEFFPSYFENGLVKEWDCIYIPNNK